MREESKQKRIQKNRTQDKKRRLVSELFAESRGSGWLTDVTELYCETNGLKNQNLTNSRTIMANAYDILKFSLLKTEDHPY